MPNTPFLDLVEASDSGRNNDDNITNDKASRLVASWNEALLVEAKFEDLTQRDSDES